MSWTRRWALAGLIVAAQVGVVVVLAQCWQTSNAANPPSSVSCKRDVPAEASAKPCPVGAESCTGSVLVQAVVPASELRALPNLPAPVSDAVEVSEEKAAPPAPTPLPPPNLAAPPAPAPTPTPTVIPVAPPAPPVPDRPSVMPVPVAPPADLAPPTPPTPPTPQVASAGVDPLVTPPAVPTTPVAPVSPEMKPIAQSDALPPPMVSDPPPPAPEQKIKPTPPTVVEVPASPPMVVETPQPTAPPTPPAPLVKVPSQPKQEITCPWTLRIENVEGRAHLEARNGKEVQFRVVCSELDVQAPRGYIQAIGDVVVNGHELHGTCKKLTINWHDEHVQLDGGVFLKCHKDGQEIEVKGDKLSFRLSVISTVRADTTSDAPVRRAVID